MVKADYFYRTMNKDETQYPISRREFVQISGKAAVAAAISPMAFPSISLGASPTGDPVRIGHIGLGVRGGRLLSYTSSIPGAKVVGVCDVYRPHLQKGMDHANNPEVKPYLDYQDLLNDPKVEAVVIATPDHWHEKMLLDAVKAGKDVYCEKGWTTSLEAAKRMRAAIRKYDRVTQLGHQGRQHAAAEVARKMIQDGALGEITLIKTGRYINGPEDRPPWRWYGAYSNYDHPDPKEVWSHLDWKRWLGSSRRIDFNERHFWHWRCYWEYGTGQAGDLLSHELDFVQSIARHGIPDTCICSGINAHWKDDREVPDTWMVNYHYQEQNRTVQFEGVFNSKRNQPPEFCGRNARMIFNNIGQAASRFEVFADGPAYVPSRYPQPEPTFSFVPGKEHAKPSHMENFLQCVRTRERTWCNEDEAFIEAVTLLMSVESYRRKRLVRWDPKWEWII